MTLQSYNHLTIREIINNLSDADKLKLDFKYQGETILDNTTVCKYLLHEFGSFECYNVIKTHDFVDYYETWVTIHHTSIIDIYKTLIAEYNPLANYDKTSTITTTGSATTSGNNDITTQETTEDNDSFNNTAKSISNSGATSSNTNTVTETTTGNIGTMTTGYMLAEEITNRIKYCFAEIILKMFANDCLV